MGADGLERVRGFADRNQIGQRREAWKSMSPGQPFDIMHDAQASGLDAAVVGVDRLVRVVGRHGEIVEKQRGVVVHRDAVRLEPENQSAPLSRIACAVSFWQ